MEGKTGGREKTYASVIEVQRERKALNQMVLVIERSSGVHDEW